jgi:hypothetical protein
MLAKVVSKISSRRRIVLSVNSDLLATLPPSSALASQPAATARRQKMLSPHEIATLMLIKHAPDQIDPGHVDLDALLQRQLVALDNDPPGQQRPYVTRRGEAILHAVARVR